MKSDLEKLRARLKNARDEVSSSRHFGFEPDDYHYHGRRRASRNRASELAKATKEAGGRGLKLDEKKMLSTRSRVQELTSLIRDECRPCRRLARALRTQKKELARSTRLFFKNPEAPARAKMLSEMGIAIKRTT